MARDPRSDRPSLDPQFVASQTFSSSFRGFDAAEVRAYLEVIADLLRGGEAREEALTLKLADAEERLAHPPPLDEQQLTALLGEETSRVIGTARQAALEIRSKSEENAARLVREAIDEAASVRSAAEQQVAQMLTELEQLTLAERAAADEYASKTRDGADEEIARLRADAGAETQRLREEAESILTVRTEEAERAAAAIRTEVEKVRSTAAEETSAQRAETTAQVEAEIEAARQQGRAMVAEARTVRERMLTDLVERRRLGRAHLDQLRGTRQWMLEVLEQAQARIEEAAADLAAPLANDHVVEDRAPQDAEDEALLEAMMSEQPERTSEQPENKRPDTGQPKQGPEAFGALGTVSPAAVAGQAAVKPASEPSVGPPAAASGPAIGSPGSTAQSTDPPADLAVDPGRSAGEVDPASGGEVADIDALFAKIRAARADDVERAEEVLVDLTEPAAAPMVEGPAAGAVNEPMEPLADSKAPDQLVSVLERRDAATDEIERRLARRLKRVLSDEQNELLDEARRAKGVPSAEAILPASADHAGRYAQAAAEDLVGAAAAGARFYGDPPAKVTTEVDDIASRLAEELVRQLRGRLGRCFTDAEGDEVELGDRIRACYREWKTQRIADTSRHFVLAAFTRGLFDAAPRGSAFRWIVDDGGTPCPDAEDNALQGDVAKGDPFPTGDAYPPAHPGCRCLIVPVEAAVISQSTTRPISMQ
ncbi:MAG: DivIVA domain-containing protein [Actinomycetota bacterium]|nr:DivIVA domain-containing protein [Actinomycetota bacterium]